VSEIPTEEEAPTTQEPAESVEPGESGRSGESAERDGAAGTAGAVAAAADAADAESAGSADGAPAPIVVACPQCAVPADPVDLCCPSCHEDLAALVRLRYAGRIAFNDALGLLREGRTEAAVAQLERAVAAEPGLLAAQRLLAGLSPAGVDTR
jgi:hypothetical protein